MQPEKGRICMAGFDVKTAQNVEVSRKIPPEKSPEEQLRIMSRYTDVYRENLDASKEKREIECLKVLYPALFRKNEPGDLFAGRLDFLPIGFGCVTSLGGVGHYCVFNKLDKFRSSLGDPKDRAEVDRLYQFWLGHDVKTLYCRKIVDDAHVGMFIDTRYPMIATARLSGMMLDYYHLMEVGIPGILAEINERIEEEPENEFLLASREAIGLFITTAEELSRRTREEIKNETSVQRKEELSRIAEGLISVTVRKPATFHEAIQLFWLYSLMAGVINYGRADDFLGPFLASDIESGRMTEEDGYRYIKCLWTMIENRRTTVNGRIVVGGKGRLHPKEADVFGRIALKVARDCRYVEPQFTLRVTKDTPEDIWDSALDALGAGATYPTLYNDEVNVPAVSFGMRVPEEEAEKYVPFGCTEFVLQGESTGTPNVCLNLLKLLTILLNDGVDPEDGVCKMGPVKLENGSNFASFDELVSKYKELLDYYMDLSIKAQMYSYELMNREVSFLFTSILMKDCIGRGRAVLDGGIRYLGGTNEIYGLINASDSLMAIEQTVYRKKDYTIQNIREALLHNFKGYEVLRKELWDCPKYGNDLDEPDRRAKELYEYVAKGIRDRGIKAGMQYYLVVISNNQLNTEWGRSTGASPDGRYRGQYMNPANNPQGGANVNGPTAMLNSLVKLDPKYHAGSVQNIKFAPSLFNENRDMIKALFKAYFRKGGCHIIVTVVGRGTLEDAVKHPDKYRDLIVRVSGFSAVFVNLEPDIQQEIISRVLYD